MKKHLKVHFIGDTVIPENIMIISRKNITNLVNSGIYTKLRLSSNMFIPVQYSLQ